MHVAKQEQSTATQSKVQPRPALLNSDLEQQARTDSLNALLALKQARAGFSSALAAPGQAGAAILSALVAPKQAQTARPSAPAAPGQAGAAILSAKVAPVR